MATTKSGSGIDQALTKALRSAKLDRAALGSVIATVKQLGDAGWRPRDVFPIGIPVIDSIRVELHGGGGDIERLIPFIIAGRINGLEVLTKGIPKPDLFIANATFKVGPGPVER